MQLGSQQCSMWPIIKHRGRASDLIWFAPIAVVLSHPFFPGPALHSTRAALVACAGQGPSSNAQKKKKKKKKNSSAATRNQISKTFPRWHRSVTEWPFYSFCRTVSLWPVRTGAYSPVEISCPSLLPVPTWITSKSVGPSSWISSRVRVSASSSPVVDGRESTAIPKTSPPPKTPGTSDPEIAPFQNLSKTKP